MGSQQVTVIAFEVTADGTVLDPASFNTDKCYISSTPSMPQITARLLPSGLPDSAFWQLLVEYRRSDRNDVEVFPASPRSVSASAAWNVTSELGGDILGGKATLTLNYYPIGVRTFVFHIRGENPSPSQVMSHYPVTQGPWFMMAMIRHESGSFCAVDQILQFNKIGTLGPEWEDYKHCPNRSSDGHGWGIMQLTNPVPPRRKVWDWKQNLEGGFQLLMHDKWFEAHQSWQNSTTLFDLWRAAHPTDPNAQPPVKESYSSNSRSVIYAYSPVGAYRSFEEAVWIKRYNGNSLGDYMHWNNTLHKWEPHRTNSLNFNYVQRISEQYCECPQ